MIDEYDALRAGTLERDLGILEPRFEAIEKLINQNPFSQRIKFLVNNLHLAKKPIMNLHRERIHPNCIGTALWIAGVGRKDYPYHAYSNELNQHMEEESSWVINNPHIERRVPGAFVFSYCTRIEDWHAGIYLGQVGDEHIAFAHHGMDKNFGPESLLNCYDSPEYHIPKSLKNS